MTAIAVATCVKPWLTNVGRFYMVYMYVRLPCIHSP